MSTEAPLTTTPMFSGHSAAAFLTMKHAPSRPIDELIVAVLRLNGSLIEAGSRRVEDIGLTPAWWQVLGALALSPTL